MPGWGSAHWGAAPFGTGGGILPPAPPPALAEPHSYEWQILHPTVPVPVLPTGAGVSLRVPDFLGYGLAVPFARGAHDFVAVGGSEKVRVCVVQILGTRCESPFTRGELPWRTEFGSILALLRHKPNDEILGEIALAYATDAIGRWEPRAQTTSVRTTESAIRPRKLDLAVKFTVITRNVSNNEVSLPAQTVTVPLTA